MTSVLLGMIKINEIEIRFFLIPLNRTHQHFFTDLLREKKEKIPGLFLILCMSHCLFSSVLVGSMLEVKLQVTCTLLLNGNV